MNIRFAAIFLLALAQSGAAADERTERLDRLSDAFCRDAEALHQQLCHDAGLKALIAEGNKVARQVGVLSDGDE